MKKVLYIFITQLVFSPVNTYCQSGIDCRQLLENYIEKMAGFSLPGDKVYYLNLELYNQYKKTDISYPAKQQIHYYITKGKMIYESPVVSLFMDNEDFFVVMHDQKKILWNASEGMQSNDIYKSSFASFQKEFISNGFIHCKDSVIHGHVIKYIRIDFDILTEAKDYNVDHVIYYYDPIKEIINHSEVFFKNHRTVSRQVYEFKELNFNYQGLPGGSVKKQVFTTTGKLKKEYYGYSIINNKSGNK